MLIDDLRAHITGYAGLSITVLVGGRPTTFTAMTDDTAALAMLSSLSVAMPGGGQMIYFSRAEGAFDDLAAAAGAAVGRVPTSCATGT